jgi:hypothetical protein
LISQAKDGTKIYKHVAKHSGSIGIKVLDGFTIAILALVQEGRVTGVSLKQNQMHHGKSCLGAVRSLPDAFNLRAGLLGGIESWASSVGTSHPGRHGRQGQVNWGEGQEDDDDWERLPCPRL